MVVLIFMQSRVWGCGEKGLNRCGWRIASRGRDSGAGKAHLSHLRGEVHCNERIGMLPDLRIALRGAR
jgi:hypothetical protein